MIERQAIIEAARRHGFDLAGIVRAADLASAPDVPFFFSWLSRGCHAGLSYLTGERTELRRQIEKLLPGLRSVICVAKNYNAGPPYSTSCADATRAWISRYAWSDDYHRLFRRQLKALVAEVEQALPPAWSDGSGRFRIAVDTSPLLERALARHSAVGWMGKNTCVINQQLGSWLFLGEVLTTLELPPDDPAPDRCGTCTRCIDACPTGALVEPRVLDSRRCISYWTIEVRGSIPESMRPHIGRHVFGCDICQDVCPWNRKAAVTTEPAFQPREGLFNPPLEELAEITEEEFAQVFRNSTVLRTKYQGFLRNVCVAMGNSGDPKFVPHLQRLAAHADPEICKHAKWAVDRIHHKATRTTKNTKKTSS